MIWLLALFLAPAWAGRLLSATSLVTCMDNSQISPSYFNVTFDASDRSLRYSLDLTTEILANVLAHVQIYAYGFVVIDKKIDMCDLGWKQFCPMYPGLMQIESIEYISADVADQIPGIAYTVPDIDAVVKVNVYDIDTGELLSCLQSSFSNGKTVSQVGIKWATACVAGLGLLIAAIMLTFGNLNAALHIATNAVSLFMYFQSVIVVAMQSVERVPPIALAWSENLAWSMGLIRVGFMQKIFRWYVQLTGGTPTLYFVGTTKQILVQRALGFLSNLHEFAANSNRITRGIKRSLDYSLSSNQNLIVLRGIERIGYNSHIEPTSIVVTGFTFFVLMGFVLVVILVFIKLLTVLLIRLKKMNPNRMGHFRKSFPVILKGSMLRYISIGFPQLVILSLWEFTVRDSPAVVVLAVLTLVLAIGIMTFACWNTHISGTLSKRKYNNSAAILYGDNYVLQKFGFCYTMFHAEKYWFGIVIMCHALVKGIFLGLCQASGKVSSFVFFFVDFAFMVFLFIQKPYMNKSTNILNYCVAVVVTLNSLMFIFFLDFGQPAQVGLIMGWIFFILNAAFSFVLLIMIFVLTGLALSSKNPDARFAPAKDDRTSFQRKSSIKHRSSEKAMVESNPQYELFALGAAAQAHQANWESEMSRLNDMNTSSDNASPDDLDEKAQGSVDQHEVDLEPATSRTFGEALRSKLKRKFSKKEKSDITRMSDVLDSEEPESPMRQPITHNRHELLLSVSADSNYSNSAPTRATRFV